MSKLREGSFPALVDMLDVLLLCSPVFMWWLDWCLGLMFSTESHCSGGCDQCKVQSSGTAFPSLHQNRVWLQQICKMFLSCSNCLMFSILKCNVVVLQWFCTFGNRNHASILLSQVFPFYCQPRMSCVTRTWHIVCDIYISTLQVSYILGCQKFLMILAASSHDHNPKCGITIYYIFFYLHFYIQSVPS